MIELNEIYIINKKLDDEFFNTCNVTREEMTRKNILELLVELGELANETRCFKYWSSKAPSSKEVILAEYSDCLMLSLYFTHILNISLDEIFPKVDDMDVVDRFIYLYSLSSSLKENLDIDLVKKIISNLVMLGHQLGYSNEDFIKAFNSKNKENIERFKTNFAY